MKNINILLDEFMIYCESKNLSKKTMMSYEQTLKLFFKYLYDKENIMDASKVSEKFIREYIKYIKIADEAKNDYDKAIEIYQEVILKILDSSNVFLGYACNNLGNLFAVSIK